MGNRKKEIYDTALEEGKRIGASVERARVLKEICQQCPVREEIPTDDPRCAESCEGCLVRTVCGEPIYASEKIASTIPAKEM